MFKCFCCLSEKKHGGPTVPDLLLLKRSKVISSRQRVSKYSTSSPVQFSNRLLVLTIISIAHEGTTRLQTDMMVKHKNRQAHIIGLTNKYVLMFSSLQLQTVLISNLKSITFRAMTKLEGLWRTLFTTPPFPAPSSQMG